MTEIEKALEDMCAEWGAVARLEPNRAALLAAITSAIEAARRDAPYAPAVIEAAEARGWERAREEAAQYLEVLVERERQFGTSSPWLAWILRECRAIRAMTYTPAPKTTPPSVHVNCAHDPKGQDFKNAGVCMGPAPTPPVPTESVPCEECSHPWTKHHSAGPCNGMRPNGTLCGCRCSPPERAAKCVKCGSPMNWFPDGRVCSNEACPPSPAKGTP